MVETETEECFMAPEHYKNIKDGVLSNYITSNITRTVLQAQSIETGGVTEMPIEFHLKKKSVSKLSFKVPWDGVLYGYVRGRRQMQEKLGLSDKITNVTIADWDDRFVLIFDTEKSTGAAAFYISGEDVLLLLENCRRVPEQSDGKK